MFKNEINSMAKQDMKYILWFEQLSSESLPQAGGKGANLGEMVSIGMPVPSGFVVNTAAFEHFIKANRLDAKIDELIKTTDVDDTDKLTQTSKRIGKMITKADYPITVKQEVTRAYNELSYSRDIKIPEALKLISVGREMAIVAVRSSATTEDLADASFAGQQASFLNVKGVPYLLDAVRRCWASLFTPRAIFYRAKKGFISASIAVVVQRMINGDKSGVTFTVHPSTGEDVCIHEATWGLGESLVLGLITPDRYVVGKKNFEIIEKHVDTKDTMHVRDVGTGRTVQMKVPDDKKDAQVMTEDELKRLTKLAVALEQHYKKPQDIEWAVKGSKIYILQTRPVTTVKAKETKGEKAATAAEEKKLETLKEVILKGMAASPGIGSGPVKVVKSMEEAGKVVNGDVLVAEMTAPDYVPIMSKAAAIVTDKGGSTSHAAIVSREMGTPCVVGTDEATKKLKDGDIVTVDGTNGVVYKGKVEAVAEAEKEEAAKPEKKAAPKKSEKKKSDKKLEDMKLEDLEEELEETIEEMQEDIAERAKPKVYMNLGLPEKIDDYKNLPFEGIGLMRIEFIIAAMGEHPLAMIAAGKSQKYINGLAAGVEKVAAAITPRPVVVRFSDFKTNEYKDLKGGEKYEADEANPMMGWRGVSRYITPKFEEAFRLECRAIAKVRKKHKNVWVMLPFVRIIDEVQKCLQIMEEEGLERGRAGLKVWIMAEVPSVVIMADEFSKLCDGFSIGSNDLTQFVLAVDRDSEMLGEMGYFNEQNLAVKVAIKHMIKEGHENDCTVSICGQAPSKYPDLIQFLVEEKIDSISVNPDVVEETLEMIQSY
jgi:pyruvate,water dikinase